MGTKTGIAWTDATWNPVTGCQKISAGCRDCYAKRLHNQRHKALLAGKSMPSQYATPFETVICHEDRLSTPLRWQKGRKIFLNSMSDVFHKDIPYDFKVKMFAVMGLASHHRFQLLTKRAEGMYETMTRGTFAEDVLNQMNLWLDDKNFFGRLRKRSYLSLPVRFDSSNWPLKNVWLGVSAETQEAANERVPFLLRTPAVVRWLSVEPMLEAINIYDHLKPVEASLPSIDWIVVGGESGKTARTMSLEWVRSLKRQCENVDIAFFMKQLSQHDYPKTYSDYNSFAQDLQVREFSNDYKIHKVFQ
jgi:protein gp37